MIAEIPTCQRLLNNSPKIDFITFKQDHLVGAIHIHTEVHCSGVCIVCGLLHSESEVSKGHSACYHNAKVRDNRPDTINVDPDTV